MLYPTKWFYLTAASGPIPCRWEGWLTLDPATGAQWFVIEMFSEAP